MKKLSKVIIALGALSSFLIVPSLNAQVGSLNQATPEIEEKIPDPEKEERYIITTGLFASPITFSRVNQEKDINYGAELAADYKNKELRMLYERNSFSSTDPVNLITVRSSAHAAIITFDINNYWDGVTLFSLATFERRREGGVQLIRGEVRAGLAGVKFDLFKDWGLKSFSLSYIPLFELIDQTAETAASTLVNPLFTRVLTRNIRHSFRLKAKWEAIKDKFTISNTFFYRPKTNLKTKDTSFKDVDLENVLKMSYQITSQVSINYRNIYSWDVRRKLISRIPSSDMENRFVFDYHITF
jgi:hypothetical protein